MSFQRLGIGVTQTDHPGVSQTAPTGVTHTDSEVLKATVKTYPLSGYSSV